MILRKAFPAVKYISNVSFVSLNPKSYSVTDSLMYTLFLTHITERVQDTLNSARHSVLSCTVAMGSVAAVSIYFCSGDI